jgi:hypothetical protein
MKLSTITFAALIALSTTASADWMDGMSNGNAAGNARGASSVASKGNTKADGTGKGALN